MFRIPQLRHKKILIFVAHPDDESLYFSGGMKFLSQNADVTVLSATAARDSLRGQELEAVCRFLKIQCDFLEIPDTGFHTLLSDLDSKFRRYLKKKHFDLIITHPPHGGEKPHPHHLQLFLFTFIESFKHRLRFGFFSECQHSLCEALNSDSLLKLKMIPLFLLMAIQTFFTLNWKSKFKWFPEIGRYLLGGIFQTAKGLVFRRFEIEASLAEKQKMLENYKSQKTVLDSYHTSSAVREYLFLLKSFDRSSWADNGKNAANDLKPYYENHSAIRHTFNLN